jgi:PD-(D/E)XK nuclease superfamily protein
MPEPGRDPGNQEDNRLVDEQLATLVDALEHDPVFAMSLGSKELFHSNLLAWFLERSPELRDGIAKAWKLSEGPPTSDGRLRLQREWHHLDLVMHMSGRQVLAVENKVFALPDESQLAGYTAAAGQLPGKPSLVLLSLTDPGWPGDTWTSPDCPDRKVWRYRSYAELANLIRPLIPAVGHNDAFAGELLGRWADLIDRLVELASLVGSPGDDEPLLLKPALRQQLQRVRLDAAVQKMRCQRVAAQVRKATADGNRDGKLRFKADLTNAVGLVEAFTCGAFPAFGWQLQGEQFRLAMVVGPDHPGHGTSASARAARFAEAERHAAFFDFGQVRRAIASAGGDHPGPGQQPRFRRFDPDFVYRYVVVPDITVGQAASAGTSCTRWLQRFAEVSPATRNFSPI